MCYMKLPVVDTEGRKKRNAQGNGFPITFLYTLSQIWDLTTDPGTLIY